MKWRELCIAWQCKAEAITDLPSAGQVSKQPLQALMKCPVMMSASGAHLGAPLLLTTPGWGGKREEKRSASHCSFLTYFPNFALQHNNTKNSRCSLISYLYNPSSLSLSFILRLSSSCSLAVSRLKNGSALAREKQLLIRRLHRH